MGSDELFKVALAAVFGAVAKEIVALIISASRRTVGHVGASLPRWFARYWPAADFGISAGLTLYWVGRFWAGPFDSAFPTHETVRIQIVQALLAVTMLVFALMGLKRWIASNERRQSDANTEPGRKARRKRTKAAEGRES